LAAAFPEALATVNRLLAWGAADPTALVGKASLSGQRRDIQAAESVLANPGSDPKRSCVQALSSGVMPPAIADILKWAGRKDRPAKPAGGTSSRFDSAAAGDVAAARATYQNRRRFQRQLGKVAPGSLTEASLHSGLGRAYAVWAKRPLLSPKDKKLSPCIPLPKDAAEGPVKEDNRERI